MKNTHTVYYQGQEYPVELVFEKEKRSIKIGGEEYSDHEIVKVEGIRDPYDKFNIILQGKKLQVIVLVREDTVFLVENGIRTDTGKAFNPQPLSISSKILMLFIPLLPIFGCCFEAYLYYGKYLSEHKDDTIPLCLLLHGLWLIATYVFFVSKNPDIFHDISLETGEKYRKIYISLAVYLLIYGAICLLRLFV